MDQYEVLKEIGKGKQRNLQEGSYGSVYKVKRKSDDQVFVWKELDYGKMNEKERQHIV